MFNAYFACFSVDVLAAADGAPRWSSSRGCSGRGPDSIAIYAGRIWMQDIGGEDHQAVGRALDARTGQTVGTFPPAWAPAFHGHTVLLVRGGDGVLEARDIETGATAWTVRPSEPLRGAPFLVNDIVYAGTAGGALLGFDVATGREVWRRNIGRPLGDGRGSLGSMVEGFGAGDGMLVTPWVGGVTAWAASPVRVTGGPRGATQSTSARFDIEHAGAGGLECRVDGAGGSGEFAPCASPVVLEALPDGEHALHVRAVSGGPTVVRRWTVDTTPPQLFVDARYEGTITWTRPEFRPSMTERGTLECRTDADPWRDCQPVDYAGLYLSGSHVFEVRATDFAGNVAIERRAFTVVAGASVEWRQPTTPAWTSAASLEWSPFVSNAPAGTAMECRMDDAPFRACPLEVTSTFDGLGEGRHRLEARAVLTDGTRRDPSTRTWVIDRTGPAVRIDEGPREGSRSAGRRFVLGAAESATYRCSLDEAEWQDCDTPLTLPGLEPGAHVLRIRALDALGNEGPVLERRWTADPAAFDPDPVIRLVPDQPIAPPPAPPAPGDRPAPQTPAGGPAAPQAGPAVPAKPAPGAGRPGARIAPRLRIVRAVLRDGRVHVHASVRRGVTGRVSVTLRLRGRSTRFAVRIPRDGQIRFVRRLPRSEPALAPPP